MKLRTKLWREPDGRVASGRRVRWSHPQRRKGRGPAGHAGEQVRACHQCSGGQGARPHRAADAARGRRRGDRVTRREFLTLLGGAAAAWPLAARGQQAKGATIGLLGTGTAAAQSQWTAAFVQRMRELGWVEGSTRCGFRGSVRRGGHDPGFHGPDLPRQPGRSREGFLMLPRRSPITGPQ
jgi:hypothetical protein